MARPPKLAIHRPIYQLKDFFVDESMRRIIPHNPYNLLWIIENAFDNDIKYKDIKKQCFSAIKENSSVESNDYPPEIKNALIDDKWVIKRVQELHQEHKVDTSVVALKSIRIGSVELIKALFNLGLDPNYVDEAHRSTLSTCINRKKATILDLYFNHPKMNRYILNDIGENVGFSCVRYQNWKFLEKIIDVEPNLLLTKSKKNETIFDLLGQKVSGREIICFIPNSLKDKLTKIIDYMHDSGFDLPIPEKGNGVIEFIVNHNHSRLQKSMNDKEITKEIVRKI